MTNTGANCSLRAHLLSRGLDPDRSGVVLDDEKGVATFLMFNLSGQIVGYQQYNPQGDKHMHDICFERKDEAKYYTHAGYEGDANKGRRRVMVWGIETLSPGQPFVFVAEGVFDAVKLQNEGLPAVATIANDPKHLRSFFMALGRRIIAVCDRDVAGSKLSKFADVSLVVPEPYKDLGEMPQEEVGPWLRTAFFGP